MQPTTIMFLRILFVLLWHCSAFSDAKQKIEKIQHQKSKILSIEANCTRDVMHVRVNMGQQQPFKGAIYAKGFSEECSSAAGSSSVILPLSACGIRSRFFDANTMQYGVRIVVQMDAKLQQKSDEEAVAKCSVPSEMMDVNVQDVEPSSTKQQQQMAQRTGRMRHYMKPSSKVRAWLEVGSREGQDFSLVGENSTLKIRSFIKRNIGMKIVDCVAFDGVGESSQRLFDEYGCPIDAQLMDDFSEEIVNIEDGWSKLNDDDVVQKIHTTKFQAFKFPDRDTIHFNCGIMLCKGECPSDVCSEDESKHRKKHKPLGRIEVFNSLKVLAPQIEIDRVGDKNFTNVYTAAQSSAKYLGPDVLCVSQSKLALAFCTLGLIFLVAVFIAIFFSFRYLSQRRSVYHRSSSASDNSGRRSIFSVSSSSYPSQSSLDIDSKLFAYGRVY